MCTNLTADPVVSGKNGRFGILNGSHEFFKRGSEGRVLFWSVEDGAALKQRISGFLKNGKSGRNHPYTADLGVGLNRKGSDNPLKWARAVSAAP
jgi:hypothetical protein